jgi:hypothetical protein
MALALNGCSSSTKMVLQMQAGQTASYESTTTMIKDYKFEQPTMKKLDENQTSTAVTVKFDQTVTEVGQDGTAIADIVIKGIQCKVVSKNEARYEFDSADAAKQADKMNDLIGQSYRISISSTGQVKVLDATAIRAVAVTGEGQNLAKKMLSDESIVERHQLPLPEGVKTLSARQSWTQVVPSPPGLLASKTFEKVYTVAEVGKDKVVVNMVAKESLGKKADGQSSGGTMGMFAKMFDSQDDFTGSLVFNPADGGVMACEEKLVSTYTASEMPQNAPADALPDTLMMRLTNGVSLKKLQ